MLSGLNSGSYDVITDFGTNGLWKYSGASWTSLTSWDAENFMLSGLNSGSYDVITDFSSNGFWKYSNNQWSQLTSWDANYFVLSANTTEGKYDVIADFGSNGFWKNSNDQWSQLTTWTPDPEISERLDVQNRVQAYGKTAEGGFTFTSALSGGPTKQEIQNP